MTNRLHHEKELHSRIAGDYLERYNYNFSALYNHYWNQRLIEFIPKKLDLRILDLGCGTGFLLEELNSVSNNSVGLDLSADMLKLACEKEKAKRRLILGSGDNLPFADGVFDVVVCRGSLHHMPNLEHVLSEIRRILMLGGHFILSEPCNDAFWIRSLRKFMYKISNKFCEEDEGYRMIEITKKLRAEGFILNSCKRFGLFGYAFAGFPDRLGLLKYTPFNTGLTKLFIFIDKMIEKIFYLQRACFQILIDAIKS